LALFVFSVESVDSAIPAKEPNHAVVLSIQVILVFFPRVKLLEAECTLSVLVVRSGLFPVFSEVGPVGESLSACGTRVVTLRSGVPDQAHLVFVLVVGLQLQARVKL